MKDRILLPHRYEPGKIGIATVLYNSSLVLPDFFHSLQAQTYTKFVVYAVDNVSSDRSASLCREQPRFIVTENTTNTGFAHGTNQGIHQALEDGCEAVLVLNNDVCFPPDFLELLVAGKAHHQAAMVAPMTYYHDRPNVIWAAGGTLQLLFGYRPVHLGMGEQDHGQSHADRPIRFAPGSCILIDRFVFSRIGLFDETFFTYWEDADFAVRALKEGLRTYLIPKATLWHKVSSLAGLDSPFQRYYAVRNHALYLRKHCSPVAAGLLSFLYLSAYRLAGLRARIEDPRVKIWKEGWVLFESSRDV